MQQPYRVLYHTNSGRIEICRRMSDKILAIQLANSPGLASLDHFCEDVTKCRVDLDTLEVIHVISAENYTAWMRERRNKLLTQSDWTQGEDSPLSAEQKAQWATYRQALRDLPDSVPNPLTSRDLVTWPTKPE